MPRYSRRLPGVLSTNALTRLIEEKRKNREQILDLTVSNPTVALGAAYPSAEIRAAIGATSAYEYRPNPIGIESAREAVSQYYETHGLDVAPSSIALTASTSEAYSLLFKLFCDPGDEVLVPSPSYPLFEYLASLECVRPVPYALHYDGAWSIDFAGLRQNINGRSRAIVIVNPNNPTGSFLKRGELALLDAIALEFDIPIISDEVFLDYAFSADLNRVQSLAFNRDALSFSLGGLSKAAAMPQMKLAWIVISGPELEKEAVRSRLEILLDTYLSVNSPVQLALGSLLQVGSKIRAQLLSRVTHNLAVAHQMLSGTSANTLRAEGGWSVVIQLPKTRTEEEWMALLLGRDLLLQPGYFFDMPSEPYAIASLIVPPEDFAEGLHRLRAALTLC